VFSCSKIEQKQLNTWVSFQSAEQPLLGQFSVSGNKKATAAAMMADAVIGRIREPTTSVAPALVALPEITLSWGFPRHAAIPLQTISASSSSAAMAAVSSSIIGHLSSGL